MRICITGGLGFIGSYIVRELIRQGYKTVILDIRHGEIPEGAELIITDVTDFEQVLHAINEVKPDVVYHLAGTILNIARKNTYLAVRLDVLGTANVLEACIRCGVSKVLYASSFYVYDGISSDRQVTEQDHGDIFVMEMFGVAKLIGERLVHEYASRHGLKYVILRYGPVYGPHERCSCVIYEFIKEGLAGKPIVVWGKGKRKNQYTYVEDIARGCVKALPFENETFNLISPQRVSIREIATILSQKYGFKVVYDLSKNEGPSMPYISPRKAINRLNWKPIELKEGIDRTIETYLKRKRVDKRSSQKTRRI